MEHRQANPIKTLLNMLEQNGFVPLYTDDGEETFLASIESPFEVITSVDESTLTVQKDNEKFSIFIVLGNEDCEIVNDYTSRNTSNGNLLGSLVMKHYQLYGC
jgi:hypothetical protein